MRLLRNNRIWIGSLASLTLVFSVFASALVCPAKSAGYQRQIFDSVLGWITICAPSKAGSSNHSNSGSHSHCAQMCAAAAGTTFAVSHDFVVPGPTAFSGTIAISSVLTTPVAIWPSGALGSRAPPVLI